MKVSRYYYIAALIAVALLIAWTFLRQPIIFPEIGEYTRAGHLPKIRPDYSGVVIPPNMAPLNFFIKEKGELFSVKIYSHNGNEIKITSKSPLIQIPLKKWQELLIANRSGNLYIDVYIKTKTKGWKLFDSIENRIAKEEIDNYLVFRKIRHGCGPYDVNGLFQRDLRNFTEQPIIEGSDISRGCVNCHSFCNNNPEKMSIAIRSTKYTSNSILIDDGKPSRIGTKFGFSSWHPSGRLIAFSVNKYKGFYHSARDEVRDVMDLDSAIAYYSISEKTVKTSPCISKKNRMETYPTWSPDGKYLYFSSAEILCQDTKPHPPVKYTKVRYDLMRVNYDIATDKWGEIETVLLSKETGLSIIAPRISPDGRWLLCCMCDYGSFPVHQTSSDLYLIDLKAPRENGRYEYRRLALNSKKSESWHSFSSNSRWMAFSSKKDYGEFTRTYFSYIDDKGTASKPILMPQKDPALYDSNLKTYSVPEFVTKPVSASRGQLARVVRANSTTTVDMPITMATPKPRAKGKNTTIWNELEYPGNPPLPKKTRVETN